MFLALGIHEVLAEIESQAANYPSYLQAAHDAKAIIMPGGMGEIFKVLAHFKDLNDDSARRLKVLIPPKYRLLPPD